MTIKSVHTPEPINRLEYRISQLLRSGVLFAGMFMLVGWIWMWVRGEHELTSLSDYQPISLWESLQWAVLMNNRPLMMCYIGLFILVLLPVVRVLLTGILFLRQKDVCLAGMAFLVFVVLLGSFVLGIEI